VLKLLGRKTSGNVQKVIWFLEETGLPYAREDYGRQFGNTADEAYLSLNPNGKVPTLVDGDLVIWESNTILRYLSNKYDALLYPADAAERSVVERWMDWQLSSLNNPYLAIFKGAKLAAAERDANWASDVKELNRNLDILDNAVAGKTWLAGESLTIADICLAPIISRCLAFPVDLGAFVELRSWATRATDRPAFKKAVA
jgi:glutathione S-transferase